MLGKRFEILSYAICKISFECYASVWHAIYESAILLGLINNTLEKTKWICKSEHYLFRVHGKTKWNFHGVFFHLKMSLKSYYWYHKNCALNEGPD